MYRTDFWTMWEKARVGCFKRTALKHVYYLGWNRSPAQVGCMRQVLRPGVLERPRGIGWRGRWEGGSGWGIHVKPWLILVSVWEEPLQCCEVIGLQLIKKKKSKKKTKNKKQLTFSSPVATAEFSKLVGILSAALSLHHLLGFEIAQLEFHHLQQLCS